MMHAGAKNPQPSLAAQSIVASQNDRRVFVYQSAHDQLRQQFPKMVPIPSCVAEEPMVVREMSIAYRIAGNDYVGNVTVTPRDDPAGHQ